MNSDPEFKEFMDGLRSELNGILVELGSADITERTGIDFLIKKIDYYENNSDSDKTLDEIIREFLEEACNSDFNGKIVSAVINSIDKNKQKGILNSINKNGYTPLTLALSVCNIGAGEVLLKSGANPYFTPKDHSENFKNAAKHVFVLKNKQLEKLERTESFLQEFTKSALESKTSDMSERIFDLENEKQTIEKKLAAYEKFTDLFGEYKNNAVIASIEEADAAFKEKFLEQNTERERE